MTKVLPPISALGTVWLVEIFDEVTTEKTDEAFGLIRLFLSDFEAKYSRFKPASDISILNRTGQLENPDKTTILLLNLGQQFYKDTDGIFNILVGEYLLARGYDADYSFSPKAEPVIIPSPLESLIISDSLITLTVGQLDLGGYGKGFLIDRLAEYLQELGFQYFLINGGGDMYATSDHDNPITIYLEHPILTSTYIAETTIKNQGFAASSTHKRRWKVAGQEYSHIIDTTEGQRKIVTDTNGKPDTLGLYTKAPTAVMADAWATTLLISNPNNHASALKEAHIEYASFNTSNNTLTQSSNF